LEFGLVKLSCVEYKMAGIKIVFASWFVCGLVGAYFFIHIVSNKFIVATTFAFILAFAALNHRGDLR